MKTPTDAARFGQPDRAPPPAALVEVRDLHAAYDRGVKALEGVSFSVGRELVGLLGPNGAGKTTLLRILARRLTLQRGDARLAGVALSDPSTRAAWLENLGYLPQDDRPPAALTGREVVETALALVRPQWPRTKRRETADLALARVGLSRAADRRGVTYSGGMQRRLALARVLAPGPGVLLVDEPTSGLDPQERVAFRDLLSGLADVSAVVVSTHITADVEVSCSRVMVLYRGRILWDGVPSALIRRSVGRVRSAHLTQNELDALPAGFRVTSMIPDGDAFAVRYLAPPDAAGPGKPTGPTLEEAYVDLMTAPCAAAQGARRDGDGMSERDQP